MNAAFSPENIQPGTRVGVYVVGPLLGIGGGGVVYEAKSPHGYLVALKISRYRPGVAGSRDTVMDGRFWRGHMCQEQLHGHPNVLELYGYDRHPDTFEGWQYEVLELVPGAEPITDWVRRTTPSFKHLVLVFQRLAVTIGDMHWFGIRHRDLKPGNILVSPDGVPKILDFNSATHVNAKLLTKPAASALPGTAAYFPPEVCRAVLKERWTKEPRRFAFQPTGDLHALGVLLYETLTGRHPFNLDLEGDDLLVDIAHRTPERPSSLNPHVPRELDEIVMMLLEKNPERRHQSAYTVAAELEMLLNLSPEADTTTSFEVPRGEWTNGHRTTRPGATAGTEAPTTPDQVPPPSPAGALARVELEPALEARPPPARPRRGKARLALGLVAGALLLAVGLTVWTRSVVIQKGTGMPKGIVNRTVMVLSCALMGCPGVKVRPEGADWLAKCSPEAKETPAKLKAAEGYLKIMLVRGENVRYLTRGVGVREGPIQAEAHLGLTQKAMVHGYARTGTDGVSMVFDRIEMQEIVPGYPMVAPPGTTWPICIVAWDHAGPGYPDFRVGGRFTNLPPAHELPPGWVGVQDIYLQLRMAR